VKMTIPTYPEYLTEKFARETKDFRLEVLQDDGMYRHLVFCSPKTMLGNFNLTTWPGYLHIGGDRDGFTFSRLPDMFEFFRLHGSNQINPDYWQEKITDGRERAKEYSRELMEQRIWEDVRHAYQIRCAPEGLAKAVQEKLIEGCDESLEAWDTAYQAVDAFSHDGFHFYDICEWSCAAYNYHFLMSCHAVAAIISAYDAAKAVANNG
jgi:hypothetical protein